MLRTAVQRANEILPALTHCFFCMRCRRNIGMYKLLRKACIFCFRDRTYSYDDYFCIAVPGMYAILENRLQTTARSSLLHILVLVLQSKLSRPRCDKQTAVCPLCCIRAYHMFCMSLQIVAGRMYVLVVWYE